MLALVRYDQLTELAERIKNGTTLGAALTTMFSDSAKRLEELSRMRSERRRDYRACRVIAVADVDAREFTGANPVLRHVARAREYDYFILNDSEVPKTIRWNKRVFINEGIGRYRERVATPPDAPETA